MEVIRTVSEQGERLERGFLPCRLMERPRLIFVGHVEHLANGWNEESLDLAELLIACLEMSMKATAATHRSRLSGFEVLVVVWEKRRLGSMSHSQPSARLTHELAGTQ